MKRYLAFSSFDEADKKARSLIGGDRITPEGKPDVRRIAIRRKGKIDEAIYFSSLDERGTRPSHEVGYVYSQIENHYGLTIFAPEEWGRYTYVFRNLQPNKLFIPVSLHANFVKPSKPVSLDEAISAAEDEVISSFFATKIEGLPPRSDQTTREQLREFTRETAFTIFEPDEDEDERTLQLDCNPPVYVLAEETGREIHSPEDYEQALSTLLDANFSDEEKKTIKESYLFYQGERLINYALYEFLRTESYDRLKEILASYPKFGLPDDWEENLPYLWATRSNDTDKRITAEEFVLSKYLAKDASKIVGGYTFREIAEYTGTPIDVVIKCSNIRVW